MFTLFRDVQYVWEYIDDLLVTTCGSFTDHLVQLDLVLQRIKRQGSKSMQQNQISAEIKLTI